MNINTANLMVGKAASTDNLRMNLNSIHVTAEYTEATNGHIMARVGLPLQFPCDDVPDVIKTEDAEYLEPFVIPAKAAMSIKTFKAKGKTGIPCLIDTLYIDVEKTNMNGTAIFSATDRESVINPILSKMDVGYPDTSRVIPSFTGEDDIYHTRLNIAYLETLLAIAKSTGSESVTIDARRGDGRPVLLTAENDGQKFTGVIMPLRD
jgi:DNA polymerase III sliding clamp (beta) subunit (PCNA family)